MVSGGNEATVKELKTLKENNAVLNKEFEGMKGRIAEMKGDLQRKENEVKIKEGQIAKLSD